MANLPKDRDAKLQDLQANAHGSQLPNEMRSKTRESLVLHSNLKEITLLRIRATGVVLSYSMILRTVRCISELCFFILEMVTDGRKLHGIAIMKAGDVK